MILLTSLAFANPYPSDEANSYLNTASNLNVLPLIIVSIAPKANRLRLLSIATDFNPGILNCAIFFPL